jgi:acetyl esterase/lipase
MIVLTPILRALACLLPVTAATGMANAADSPPVAALYSALTAERGVQRTLGVSYGTHARQTFDIYEPGEGPARGPIVIFYYGGSWTSGDKSIYGFVGAAFASRGFTTVIADYRLYPEVQLPAFVEDAALAYGEVAGRFAAGRTGRPVVVMGHSAGAHIAALLALDPRYLSKAAPGAPRPAGFIGLAGPYAFDPTTWPDTKAVFSTALGNPDRARPVTFARGDAPPSLLIHGTADDVVTPDATRALYRALRAAGARSEKVEYGGVGHVGLVLAVSRPFRWRADVLDTAVGFLDQLGPPRRLPVTRTLLAPDTR